MHWFQRLCKALGWPHIAAYITHGSCFGAVPPKPCFLTDAAVLGWVQTAGPASGCLGMHRAFGHCVVVLPALEITWATHCLAGFDFPNESQSQDHLESELLKA